MIVVLILGVAETSGSEQAPATTSAAARREAVSAIPLDQIPDVFRPVVEEVVTDATLYRRMPTTVIDCHPEMFTYMAQNPEVLVEIWRLLGVSRAELVPLSDKTFALRDGGGTTGKMVVVENNCDENAQNRIVMLVNGRYEGKPFARPITAQCVLMLRSGSVKEDDDGRRYVAARLDTFVRFDRTSLEIVAKAVHPFVGKTADKNFTDTLAFVSNFSYTAERRPDAVNKLVDELKRIDVGKREQLIQLAYKCADETPGGEIRRVTAVGIRGDGSLR